MNLGNAPAFKSKHGSGLCAFGNIILFCSLKSRYFYCCSERCFRKRNRYVVIYIHSVTVKYLMLLYRNSYIQISVRTAVATCIALSTQSNALSVVNARRNIDSEILLLAHKSFSGAGLTRSFYNFTCTGAFITCTLCLHYTKRGTLLYSDSSASGTCVTGFGTCSFCRTASVTIRTNLNTVKLNILTASENCLVKRNILPYFPVLASYRCISSRSSAGRAAEKA